MNVISIQSHVAYGHVGNSAAVFALQRLGIEVWPVHTVQFSNHTGYPDFEGQVFAAGDIARLVDGLEARGALARCDALLTGYVGDPALGEVILDAATRIRAANPRAIWACDPVMGDHGKGLFVRQDVPEFMTGKALPATDIVTPNLFELEILAGQKPQDLAGIRAAAESLLASVQGQGPKVVLVTSLDAGEDEVAMLAVSAQGVWRVACPRLPITPNGAGDAVAALFLGFYLKTGSLPEALGRAASAIFEILETTLEAGEEELQFVAAQDRLEAPRRRFSAEAL
ncbi:pyridoxal kinase PdxY [Pelagibius marinus]|uniref:pyridoxal kinase PdxY n=1 Tax=Pelagibius marinus TaxID=2762760 RepID=UPI001872A3AC|nr:pyridoxal kinase PdxY [Pelagibius marinus]